jgi:hypothetical protein
VRDARHGRIEAFLLRVLARGERERAHRSAVEAAEKADVARAPGDVARELDRAFDRFRAALAEEVHHRLAHRVQRVELLRQRDLALVPVVARDVQELVGRFLDRVDHDGMTVTGRAHRDAGGEVEKAIAVDVPHFRTLAVGHDEWIVARIGRRDDLRVAPDHRFGLRSRQRGADVHGFHGSHSTLVCDCSRMYCAR